MTEEELHKALNSRINQVFDEYTDTTAGEGWALLRQKFPEKKKDRGAFWLWYAAAAVLLLCIGLWWTQKPDAKTNMVVKNNPAVIKHNAEPIQPSPVDTLISPSAKTLVKAAPLVKKQPASVLPVSPQSLVMAIVPKTKQKSAGQPTLAPINIKPTIAASTNNITVVPQKIKAKADSSAQMAKNNAMAIVNLPANTDLSGRVKTSGKEVSANAIAENKPTSAEAMNKLLNESKGLKESKPAKLDRKAVLSVYAATYFNYAKGSDNQFNAGAGFSSDFKISKRFRLSAGLAVGQNSLNYPGGITAGSAATGLAGDPIQGIAASSKITAVSSQAGFSAAAATAVPVVQNYKASLIGLDVPVNIKYLFSPQKSDTYAAVGLSSGTFINETYTLDYAVARNNQQTVTRNNFSGFDVAKTLNVSFGMGYPLGKSNRLIVEPFLKYPLDGLGAQQIKFGAGGINLKLNFLPAKK